jgi:hypothetical protein
VQQVHCHYPATAPQIATATSHNSSSSSMEHYNYRTQHQLQQQGTTAAITITPIHRRNNQCNGMAQLKQMIPG